MFQPVRLDKLFQTPQKAPQLGLLTGSTRLSILMDLVDAVETRVKFGEVVLGVASVRT